MKQLIKELRKHALIRVGEAPLMDFSPESYEKDYSNTIGLVSVTPGVYSRCIKIIHNYDFNIVEKFHSTDINHNQVSYLTLQKKGV